MRPLIASAAMLFAAFVLIFTGAMGLLFAENFLSVLVIAAVALVGGLGLLWFVSGRETRPLVHAGAALAALLVVAVLPRVVLLGAVARAADAASGGAHCFYQGAGMAYLVMPSAPVMTRDAADLSVSSMLARRAGGIRQPYATLITPDWTWLWSFRERRFVAWQRIYRGEGPPIIEGPQVEGRPPVAEVARCLDMITNRGVA